MQPAAGGSRWRRSPERSRSRVPRSVCDLRVRVDDHAVVHDRVAADLAGGARDITLSPTERTDVASTSSTARPISAFLGERHRACGSEPPVSCAPLPPAVTMPEAAVWLFTAATLRVDLVAATSAFVTEVDLDVRGGRSSMTSRVPSRADVVPGRVDRGVAGNVVAADRDVEFATARRSSGAPKVKVGRERLPAPMRRPRRSWCPVLVAEMPGNSPGATACCRSSSAWC